MSGREEERQRDREEGRKGDKETGRKREKMGCPPHSDVLVCEIKVHAVLKGHYVDTLAVSVVLQEELLKEEEGPLVRHSLAHLNYRVPLPFECRL